MSEISLNIIDFIQRRDLINDQHLSRAQRTVLKSIYGLPLDDEELNVFRRGTGRDVYLENEQREATIIAGRRAGKSGKLVTYTVCYEAFRDHGLPSGEEGYVMLLAPTLKQSRIVFRYVRNCLRNSPILRTYIAKITRDEITLTNNIIIGCYATNNGVRGRTAVAIICDEVGHWSDSENAANPAEEVLAALRPGMATVRNGKLLKISTPYAKVGLLWNEFSHRAELDFLVWQLTTFEMNLTVTPETVASERRLGEERYQREYLAQFTDSINGWIDPETLDLCIVRGRRELPRRDNVNYIAVLDAASRHDDFAMVVLHMDPEGSVVMDLVKTWTGTKKAALPFESVLFQVSEILESYGINTVTGDQFQADPISQHLRKLGIKFNLRIFGTSTRFKIFSGLKHLVVQRKIELLDDVDLLQQLRGLREEKSPRGNIDVQAGHGKDDRAVALALAVSEAINQTSALPFDIIPGDLRRSPESLGLIPDGCPNAAVCLNFPVCMDTGHCLGFEDSRLVAMVPQKRIPGREGAFYQNDKDRDKYLTF